MSHRKIIEGYYCDINNLSDMLGKLTNSYRLLIGGASELNTVALAHKKDVKAAIDRVNKLDEIINALNKSSGCYTNYCRIRSELIKGKIKMEYMENEIDEELYLNEIDEDLDEDDDKKDR